MNDLDDPTRRAALANWLDGLHGRVRWITQQWARRDRITARYQPLLPLESPWGRKGVLVCAGGVTSLFPFPQLFTWVNIGLGLIALAFALTTPKKVRRVVLFIVAASLFWFHLWPISNHNPGLKFELIAFLVSIVPVGLITWGIVAFHNRHSLVRQNAKTAQINARRAADNQQARADEDRLLNDLHAAGQDLAAYNDGWFPDAYLYEEAVAYCATAVRNHRADSITEALNLYETALHRQRLENAQAAMIAEQQRLNRIQIVTAVMNTAMQATLAAKIDQQTKEIRAAAAPRTVRVEVRHK